jgi:hypothetical protein
VARGIGMKIRVEHYPHGRSEDAPDEAPFSMIQGLWMAWVEEGEEYASGETLVDAIERLGYRIQTQGSRMYYEAIDVIERADS